MEDDACVKHEHEHEHEHEPSMLINKKRKHKLKSMDTFVHAERADEKDRRMYCTNWVEEDRTSNERIIDICMHSFHVTQLYYYYYYYMISWIRNFYTQHL